jgi:hypothetical protein
MSEHADISESEGRLIRALDRLETALAAQAGTADADLATELAEERLVTAQLTERIRTLKIDLAQRDQAQTAAPDPHLAERLAEREAELSDLRGQLDQALRDIRAITTAGQADLEALRADMQGAASGYAETLAEKDAEIAELRNAAARPVAAAADPGDLRALNELAEITAELRGKAAHGCADADLINHTMAAELEALRIARQADLAEMRRLLAELEPILEETAHA